MTRLENASSPYLRQHASNPVDWHVWGAEAFKLAHETNRPVFLSIGYAACHWCHVMERESFSDATVAEILNRDFVPIKVDRLEHPDVDSLYMTALMQMTGSGGWPLNMFLMPNGLPFMGGTYFPPEPREQLFAFKDVLKAVAGAWKERKSDVADEAKRLAQHLRGLLTPVRASQIQTPWPEAMEAWREAFDWEQGGVRQVPKFPHPGLIEAWLTHGVRSGDNEAIQMALLSLEKMARGGIYDQLGGGFHRYTVDREWRVPHYEKMLSDNALLARLYLLAADATGRDDLRQVAEATAGWMEREMVLPQGGFAAALDADTEGEEGRFYLWTAQQVRELLPEELANAVCTRFGLGAEPRPLAVTGEADSAAVQRGCQLLLEARRQRVAPARDEQLLTEWNGYAISALANLGHVDAARSIAQRVKASCGENLCHLIVDGTKKGRCLPHDLGAWIDGLIDLYQASWNEDYLTWAVALSESLPDLRADPGLFLAPPLDEEGASPSALALLVRSFAKLGHLIQRPNLVELAEQLMRRHGGKMTSQTAPLYPYLMVAASWLVEPVRLVQVTGPLEAAQPFIDAARRQRIHQVLVSYQTGPELQVMVCSQFQCTAQPRTVAELEEELSHEKTAGRR
jgi:uncharacterized protein